MDIFKNMDSIKLSENTCRQLEDIIQKAEALKASEDFNTDFKEFLNYNQELKHFILTYLGYNPKIIRIANIIPDYSISKYYRKYWYLFLIGGRKLQFSNNLKYFSKRDIDFIKDQYLLIYHELTGIGY